MSVFLQLQRGTAGRRKSYGSKRPALDLGSHPSRPAPAPGVWLPLLPIPVHQETSGDLESGGTTQALLILFTGIGGVVTFRPALVPRVPGLTAAQLVAKEGTGARWGGGRDLAVPSLVSKLAPALLNAQPGALSDAGQQVRFPLA